MLFKKIVNIGLEGENNINLKFLKKNFHLIYKKCINLLNNIKKINYIKIDILCFPSSLNANGQIFEAVVCFRLCYCLYLVLINNHGIKNNHNGFDILKFFYSTKQLKKEF